MSRIKKNFIAVSSILFLSLFILPFISALSFGDQNIKTGEFIVQSQTGIDSYYTANFTHIENSSDIQIDYCINQDSLDQAQEQVYNETTDEYQDSPYIDYQPANIRVRKDIRLGNQLVKTDETVDTQETTVQVMKPKFSLNKDKVSVGEVGIGIQPDPIGDPGNLEPIDVPANCISLIENPYLTDSIELGDHSTYIIAQSAVFSPTLNTNTLVAGNSSHLAIDTSQVPYNSLVAYYPFDVKEDPNNNYTYDYSGNGNTGTVLNSTNMFNSTCIYGSCYQFNGVNNSVTAIPKQVNGNWTLTLWVKPNIASNTNTIISTRQAGATFDFKFRAGGEIYGDIGNKAGWINNSFNTAGFNAVTGKWYFVSVVMNATNGLIYINGSLNNNIAWASDNPYLTDGTHLLELSYNSANERYNGSIDEVMIFNTSLTSAQITAIYNNQSSRFVSSGTQTVIQQPISSGYNQVNVTLDGYQRLFGSNISIRLGQWDSSLGYNNTDLDTSKNGLVAYYHLDNNSAIGENSTFVVDSMGLNNGTIINNTFLNSSCIYNNCYTSNTTNYINFSLVQTPQLNQTGGAISLWYTSYNTASNVIIGSISNSYKNGYFIYTTGKPQMFNATASVMTYSGSNLPSSNGIFRYYVFTWNSTNYFVYVNGNLYNSGSIIGNFSVGSNPMQIGWAGNIVGEPKMNGSIDEVMIFNRSLSASEIQELYIKGRANWNYTTYQNLSAYNSSTPSSSNIFSMSTSTTNILPMFSLSSGTSNFYTPNLMTSMGINLSQGDGVFPTFSNYADNSGILNVTGAVTINVSVASTNGSVLLEIAGNNYTATNLGGNTYGASPWINAGNWTYKWIAWGTGINNNIAVSNTRNYTVNPMGNHYLNTSLCNYLISSTGVGALNTLICVNNSIFYDDLQVTNTRIGFTNARRVNSATETISFNITESNWNYTDMDMPWFYISNSSSKVIWMNISNRVGTVNFNADCASLGRVSYTNSSGTTQLVNSFFTRAYTCSNNNVTVDVGLTTGLNTFSLSYDGGAITSCSSSVSSFLSYIGLLGLVSVILFLGWGLGYLVGVVDKRTFQNVSIIGATTTIIMIGLLLIIAVFLMSALCGSL